MHIKVRARSVLCAVVMFCMKFRALRQGLVAPDACWEGRSPLACRAQIWRTVSELGLVDDYLFRVVFGKGLTLLALAQTCLFLAYIVIWFSSVQLGNAWYG